MTSKIVFNDGEELRPEEAIVRLAQQVVALQEQISSLRAGYHPPPASRSDRDFF